MLNCIIKYYKSINEAFLAKCWIDFRAVKCNWESPTGEKCVIVNPEFEDKSRCSFDGATADLLIDTGTQLIMSNCTITITSEVLERNGDWKVWMHFQYIFIF